jgi:hypothetical protein
MELDLKKNERKIFRAIETSKQYFEELINTKLSESMSLSVTKKPLQGYRCMNTCNEIRNKTE